MESDDDKGSWFTEDVWINERTDTWWNNKKI